MASCPSCSAANPDSAKFCAHCGKPLPAMAPSQQPPVQRVAQPMASPRQPVARDVRPEPVTGKQAFQQKPQQPPVNAEPDPTAPGQTQFFVAAAGVSTSSKIKRVVYFLIGAIIFGLVIYFGLKFALRASNENLKSRVSTETVEPQPGTEATGSASPSTQPDKPPAKPDEQSDDRSTD